MALILADRVKQESTTTGTGAISFSGGVDGFQLFSAVCSTNDTMYYCIQEKIGTNFEIGHGTFNGSGQLERTNVLQSSNSDNAVNFGAGTKDVFITYPADKAVFQNYDGSITIPSTIDGRDLQTDGTKLDGIEASATADQTASEIRTLVESASDSNVFTDADHTKLNGIEASATADQTNAEIRTAVEAATDSNVFTDADHTKLNTIEASADVTDTANVTSAGALMDSEVTNLSDVKSFAPSDYATSAQGTLAINALPKAGGTMTGNLTMGNNEILLSDNGEIRLGDSEDLQIFHDGNDSVIKDHGTGALEIRATDFRLNNSANTKNMIKAFDGGDVSLYHNNSKKFETSSTGATLTGNLAVTGTVDGVDIAARDAVLTSTTTTANAALPKAGGTMTGDLILNDNIRLEIGSNSNGDLALYHDGSNSYIDERGTGDLIIKGSDTVFIQNAGGVKGAEFWSAGTAQLNYNGSKKFETTSGGATVSGTLTATTLAGSLPYSSLTGTPTIPTNNNQLSNGAGYITSVSGNITQLSNNAGYVTSSGVTSVATGNGLSGGTITSTGTLTMSGSYSGSFSASGNITAYSSDIRLKDFKGQIENALDKVNKLSGHYFEWNDTAKNIDAEAFKEGLEVGVIAQEVEKVMPEVVVEAPIVKIHNLDTDYKTVHYDKLVPLLIEAIKELKSEIEELKTNKFCKCED